MATQTAPEAQADRPLLDQIVDQRELVLTLRRQHAEQIAREVRQLAVLIAATREHPDPQVNPTAASKVMGTAKGWAHRLVKQLEAGELDAPGGDQL